MKRYKSLPVLVLILFQFTIVNSQVKVEREHRIKKNQFPEAAHTFINDKLQGYKKMRFYKETDTSRTTYGAKFKKDKLNYNIEFDKWGSPQNFEIIIKEVDVPSDSWMEITKFLKEKFVKHKIRKIYQQYIVTSSEMIETTFKNAFQNLLIPSVNYDLIVRGKIKDAFIDYEILFGAEGDFIKMRESLPANYDHVLY